MKQRMYKVLDLYLHAKLALNSLLPLLKTFVRFSVHSTRSDANRSEAWTIATVV